MAREQAKVSFKIGTGVVTAFVRGQPPIVLNTAALSEAIRRKAVDHGIEKVWRNVVAGDKDATTATLHGKLYRKAQALRAGLWEQDSSGGINWAIFPDAMVATLAEAGRTLTRAEAEQRLHTKTPDERLALWQSPRVQAHVKRIEAEQAQAALERLGQTPAQADILDEF